MKRQRHTTPDYLTSDMQRLRIAYEHSPDRISRLPNHLLHRILSYLPTKDAVKTSVLSKTWNSVWKSFPVLDFNQYLFQTPSLSGKGYKKVIKEFIKHVDRSISSRAEEATVEKLQLAVDFSGYRHYSINKWVNYAIDNAVKDLVITYRNRRRAKRWPTYILPPSLYRKTTIKTLDLFGCMFVKEVPGCEIRFCLTKLMLSRVYIGEETLQSILSNSHLLEELRVESCQGFRFVKAESTKLERIVCYFDSEDFQTVSFRSPGVRWMRYGGRVDSVDQCFVESKTYAYVRELTMHDVDIEDDLFSIFREFVRLEKLTLLRCNELKNIRVPCKLRELCISQCCELETVEFDTSVLRSFRSDCDCELLDIFGRNENDMDVV